MISGVYGRMNSSTGWRRCSAWRPLRKAGVATRWSGGSSARRLDEVVLGPGPAHEQAQVVDRRLGLLQQREQVAQERREVLRRGLGLRDEHVEVVERRAEVDEGRVGAAQRRRQQPERLRQGHVLRADRLGGGVRVADERGEVVAPPASVELSRPVSTMKRVSAASSSVSSPTSRREVDSSGARQDQVQTWSSVGRAWLPLAVAGSVFALFGWRGAAAALGAMTAALTVATWVALRGGLAPRCRRFGVAAGPGQRGRGGEAGVAGAGPVPVVSVPLLGFLIGFPIGWMLGAVSPMLNVHMPWLGAEYVVWAAAVVTFVHRYAAVWANGWWAAAKAAPHLVGEQPRLRDVALDRFSQRLCAVNAKGEPELERAEGA